MSELWGSVGCVCPVLEQWNARKKGEGGQRQSLAWICTSLNARARFNIQESVL